MLGYGEIGKKHGVQKLIFSNFGKVDTARLLMTDITLYTENTGICDEEGNLLFYCNEKYMEDSTFQLMENGDSLEVGYWAQGYGSLVLPIPEKENEYLLFHADNGYSYEHLNDVSYGLYYSKIDMQANGGLGAVVEKKIPILIDTLDYGKVTATKHANGRDWWILVGKAYSDSFYRILLTPNGAQVMGSQHIGHAIFEGGGQAVFSPDGRYYAQSDAISWNNEEGGYLNFFEFDRCTGLLSNPRQVWNNRYHLGLGVAFSPNSRFLYDVNISYIYQYDLWATDVLGSQTLVGYNDSLFYDYRFVPTDFYHAQLAPDGKIYINSGWSNYYLHTIERPNQKGVACRFDKLGFDLPTYNVTLPNYPYFRLGPLDGSACDTLGIDNHPLAMWSYVPDSTNYKKILFNDLSDYAPTSWYWEFGDGTTSDEREPEHTYAVGGDYQVCLTVANANSSDSICQVIHVDTSTILYPKGTMTPHYLREIIGCPPMTITFEGEIENADEYHWYVYKDYIDYVAYYDTFTPPSFTYTFDTAGYHGIYLEVKNGLDVYTDFSYFFLRDTSCWLYPSVRQQDGLVVQFWANSYLLDLTWDFGDGSPTVCTPWDGRPYHVYSSQGTYTVTVVGQGLCCGETASFEVVVESGGLPVANIEVDTIGCVPLEIAYHADVLNVDSLFWGFPGGSPSESKLPDVAVTYLQKGNYETSLTAKNTNGSITTTQMIYVKEEPVADFSFAADGLTITITDESKAGHNYYWDFGDGYTDISPNPIHTFAQAGNYDIVLIVTNDCGNDTIIKKLLISDGVGLPVAHIEADTIGCVPLEIAYHADVLNLDSLFWVFPGGSPSESELPDVIVTYLQKGDYETSLTAKNANGSITTTQMIYLKDKPLADFSFAADGLTITITDESEGADNYYWDFGDGTTDTTANPIHAFAQAGNYDIVLIATNDCGSNTFSRNLLIVAIEQPDIGINYSIFPNPSDGLFTFETTSTLTGKLDLTIYNFLGQVILRKQLALGEQLMEVDLGGEATGVYWYRVDYEGVVGFGKLVKE